MLTALHIASRTLVWLLLGLGLAVVVVFARLGAGPVELDWLAPRIERALVPEDGAVEATVARTELRLNREARTLELVGVDVRYSRKAQDQGSSRPFVTFPEVKLRLSVEALLTSGRLAASEILARAPSLVITRDRNGVIGLYSDTDRNDRSEEIDFGDFLRRFVLSSDQDQRLHFLRKLQISGGRVAFYDQGRASALTAKNADLTLTRREEGVDGWLRADVVQPTAGLASFQLSGRVDPDGERIAFKADVADLMPADLPAIWPSEAYPLPAEVAGLHLPIRASVEGAVERDGTLSPLTIDLRATGEQAAGVPAMIGLIDLPAYLAEPLEVGAFALQGIVAEDFGGIAIRHAHLESRGAEIGGSGRIVWREEDRTLALDLVARQVRVRDLQAFWPVGLGVAARRWVLENIEAGLVSEAEARLDLQPGDWGPAPLRDEAVTGRFAFEGLSVRYVDGMPPLEQASGTARFDADRMDFAVDGGENAGVVLNGGSVAITGMGKPGRLATRLRVLADAEGSVEQALSLLDSPPLEVAKELAIAPSTTAGRAAAHLDIRMPLYREVSADEAVLSAKARLTDVAIERLPKLDADIGLDRGRFALTVDDEAVRLKGDAAINGIPLAIDVFEPLEDADARRRIDLAGDIDLKHLRGEGAAPDGFEGGFGFKATITETASHFWVDLEADLAALAAEPPGLAFSKPRGQPGRLRASIAVPLEGAIEVKQFDLASGDLEVSGALSLAPGNDRLASLTLGRFRLGDSAGTVRLAPKGEGGHTVMVEAERLDLDALFGEGREDVGEAERFDAVIRADRLRLRGIELVDVEADAAHGPEGWRSASVIGTLASGGKLALELVPDGADRRLELRSENAGALITALDLGQRVEGGNLLLTARIGAQNPASAEGRFEIWNFVLKDAPLLARMLTLASLTGIGNLLGGDGIKVDHLVFPFTLEDRKLTFDEGLMRGSQLGLTIQGDVDLAEETIDLAGTIIPVYSLNRLIGQVPIIGRILTGADGRGAFAATFSLNGPHDRPTVYVNPLSILTPGLLRDLFGDLIDGNFEPPDIRETDD